MNIPTLDRTQLNNRGNGFPFIDPTTRKRDCNVAKVSEAIEYFNGHKLTAQQVRSAGGAVGNIPTGNNLARRVFLAEGLVKNTDFIMAKPKTLDELRKLLHQGWYVGAYIDYGEVNDNGLPSGDRNYDGIHAIGLWGWRRRASKIMVWDHDPLFDGRRQVVPMGRQHVDLALVIDALEAFAGTGKWEGWAVKIPL